MASHGYATGAVVSSFVLDRSWGLARGFQFYDDAFSAADFEHRDIALVERSARQSVDHALSWLNKQSASRPFFLWLHLYDPHSPYHPPEPYATEYKSHPYDGEIAYADAQLGRLVAGLKASHRYASTLIVFVADHGESLGEHSENDPGEQHNLADQQLALRSEMQQSLQRRAARDSATAKNPGSAPALDPATVEKLRALGYVAYKSPVSAQALAAGLSDPKDKVWEFNSILEATDNFQAGHYQQGVELLQQVRAKDPQMYLIPFMLGEAALRERDWNPAKSN